MFCLCFGKLAVACCSYSGFRLFFGLQMSTLIREGFEGPGNHLQDPTNSSGRICLAHNLRWNCCVSGSTTAVGMIDKSRP